MNATISWSVHGIVASALLLFTKRLQSISLLRLEEHHVE
jgi:hypothetical protein